MGECIVFPNYGYYTHKFSNEDLAPVHQEIQKIISSNFSVTKMNGELAGNLEKEYKLIDCRNHVATLLIPHIAEYNKTFDYISSFDMLTGNAPIVLSNLWVNFQKKHEFNPIHNHSGVFSFTIWMDIPYTKEQEHSASPGKNSILDLSGNFQFGYVNILGQSQTSTVDCDVSKNNTMILFPSKLQHSVYPFYSTDSYRVTVAGNLSFLV